MHDNTRSEDLSGFLDFPGADDLVAAGQVAPPSAAVLAAARPPVPSAPPALAPTPVAVVLGPKRRSRRLLVAAAAVAAMACGAVVYPVAGDDPPAGAGAAEFLMDVAQVASRAPASKEAPYWKVRYETKELNAPFALYTGYTDRQGHVWSVDADGTVTGPPKSLPKSKLKRWEVGNQRLTWHELGALPADPDALARRLGTAKLEQAPVLLAESPVGPRIRAALFQVIAHSEGVELVGEVEDRKGREGTAVEFPTGRGATTRLVIDPATSRLLDSKTWSKRQVEDHSTYLEVGPAYKVR
ncbi:hypothetical protein ACFV6E_22965 [Streptomyces sp. NPDC059785]|uniref:hypothetical protein n=1 Tax=Streptomyces sp. NPDC059785 TaxID=3346945 RepID=UPI0036641D19